MTKRLWRWVAVLTGLGVGACGSLGCESSSGGGGSALVCGAGSEAAGGECVSISVTYDAAAGCGAGTVLSGGVCVVIQDATVTTCGPGTTLGSGGQCVPGPDAGATCGAGTSLVGGVCVATAQEASTPVTCGAGTVDDGGVCVPALSEAGPAEAGSPCGAGTHACGAACFADDDSSHCGASCATCSGSTPACVSGACACTYGSCPAGQACVAGACVAASCSGPGNCTGGMCCSGTCIPGASCCQASDCTPVNACQTAVACTAGQCVYTNVADGASCGSGGTCCGGQCDNLQSDKFNCSACGAECYGGAVTASCFSGHCGQLVAQADNSGNAQNAGSGYPGNLGAPTLAIDANNVYFLAPSDGQVLESSLSNLGNTNPKALVPVTDAGTQVSIGMLTIDATNVYYAPTPGGFLSAGQTLASSTPIGGGAITSFKSSFTNQVVGNVSLAVDSTNLYMSLYETIGVAAKSGGTFASLAGSGVDNGNYLYGNLAADGTNLYWPVSASSNYNLVRYTVATQNIAFLATGFSEPSVLSLAGSSVFWGTVANIWSEPASGASPAVAWEAVNPWIGYMGADPATGDVYWIPSNGPGGGWGPLYKATHSGQAPVTIMPGQTWGTPVFDASNVYYMMGYSNYVQVWRSPK